MMASAIHQQELAIGIHVPPRLEPSLPPLSPHFPLGCPRAPALGAFLHASNLLALVTCFTYDNVYVWRYSLKSSRPLLWDLSPRLLGASSQQEGLRHSHRAHQVSGWPRQKRNCLGFGSLSTMSAHTLLAHIQREENLIPPLHKGVTEF